MRPLSLLPTLALALVLALAACTRQPVRPAVPAPRAGTTPDLPALFDCLRERRLALVSAHRGQADPTRAENALVSFRETVARGPLLIELDVNRSADGALVLMHDDTLDRTTSGTGPVTGRTLAELRALRLKDSAGRSTGEAVPLFADALSWARSAGVIVQVDVKRGVDWAQVVDLVRAAGMEEQVVLITYNLADTERLLKLAPGMMISASGRGAAEDAAILALARGNSRMLGFVGTREPEQAVLDAMGDVGMEAISGTLGRAGQRLDDRYMADGDGREYADLAVRGVALIASDRPVDAWEALVAAGRDGTACLAAN